MLKISAKQLKEMFDIWPIALPKRWRFKLRVATPKSLIRYRYMNHLGKKRRTIGYVLKNLSLLGGGHEHLIRSIARSNHIPGIVVVAKGVVIDGNHSLLALLLRGYNKPILIAEAIIS